jgi:hypothetical protein
LSHAFEQVRNKSGDEANTRSKRFFYSQRRRRYSVTLGKSRPEGHTVGLAARRRLPRNLELGTGRALFSNGASAFE